MDSRADLGHVGVGCGALLGVGCPTVRLPELPLCPALLQTCSVAGVFPGVWGERFPKDHLRAADSVMELVAHGQLKPRVQEVMPLERAAEAMAMVRNRQVTGRIVLQVR